MPLHKIKFKLISSSNIFESFIFFYPVYAIVLLAQLYLTLCDLMDCSLPDSPVHGIFQAKILEWVAIHFSRGSSWLRDRTCISYIGRLILYHWATREAYLNVNYKWIKVHCQNSNLKGWTFTKYTLNGEDFPSIKEIEGRRKWLIDLIMQLKLWNIENVTLDNKSF